MNIFEITDQVRTNEDATINWLIDLLHFVEFVVIASGANSSGQTHFAMLIYLCTQNKFFGFFEKKFFLKIFNPRGPRVENF